MTSHDTMLTPYDTGDRLEPNLWINPTQIRRWPGADYFVDQFDRFGKVDFDDDAGETVCVVYAERNTDGTHSVHVESLVDAGELTVVIDDGTQVVTSEPAS